MFGIERLQAIRELIKEKKTVEVTYLSKELNVSEVTIRRDLDKLEKEGLVVKTYGGAILIEEGTVQGAAQGVETGSNPVPEIDQTYYVIAETASKIIEDGDTVFIGGGAAGIALCKFLKMKESLIVVTNNIEIAMYVYSETEHKIVIIGGEIDPSSGNVVEFEQLDELLIEKAFISVDGVDQNFGYTVNEKSEVYLYKKLHDVSRNLILVAPSSIYNKRGLIKMAPLAAIGCIVTNRDLPDEFKRFYFEHNIKVHTSILNLG